MPSPDQSHHSPLRPSVLAKRGLDAWGRRLPLPGDAVNVHVPSGLKGTGLYIEPVASGHDRRVRHANVLIRGTVITFYLSHVYPLPPE